MLVTSSRLRAREEAAHAQVDDDRAPPASAALLEDDVVGLEVPVHHGGAVQVREGGDDVDADVDRLLDPEAARREDAAERLALDEVHHQHQAEGAVLHEVDHARDAVAAQAPEELGLAAEAGHDVAVERRGGQERLQRDAHADGDVLAGPDLAHAPGADLAVDPVATGDHGPGAELHAPAMVADRGARLGSPG